MIQPTSKLEDVPTVGDLSYHPRQQRSVQIAKLLTIAAVGARMEAAQPLIAQKIQRQNKGKGGYD